MGVMETQSASMVYGLGFLGSRSACGVRCVARRVPGGPGVSYSLVNSDGSSYLEGSWPGPVSMVVLYSPRELSRRELRAWLKGQGFRLRSSTYRPASGGAL
jgi:hypothetical protein